MNATSAIQQYDAGFPFCRQAILFSFCIRIETAMARDWSNHPSSISMNLGLSAFYLRSNEKKWLSTPIRETSSNHLSSLISSSGITITDDVPCFHFGTTKAGHEIDCIIEEGLQLIPLGIKPGRTANERFFEGLSYWKTLTKNQDEGFVIYGGSASQPKGSPQLISWQSIDTLYIKL